MESKRVHTAIVGGGVTGLCVAHQLKQRLGADQVRLLEASSYIGGHIRTDRVDDYLCDCGPNGFLDREPIMLEWVEELGLSGDLVQANEASASRFLLLNGQLVKLVGPPAFLFSPMLSPMARARLLCEPLIRVKRNGAAESIWDFAARRIGPQAADNLVSAMVLGVYGGDAKNLSLEHCFPRMAAMERDHGGLFRAMLAKRKEGSGTGSAMGPGGTLTTFSGGIGTLVKRATETLGDIVRTNTGVQSVDRMDNGYRLVLEDGATLQTERVVLALPAFAAAKAVAGLDETLGLALSSIDYAPIAVVCTGYPKSDIAHNLDGFGYLVPPNQKRSILGCIWASSVFPGVAPEGKALLRTMIGGALDPDAVGESDEKLLDRVRRDVHDMLGITSDPEMLRIVRHERGIPQYGLKHGDILQEIDAAEARHPGLFLTGNAYRGISMNDCVVAAYRLAERICANAASV